MIERLFRAHPRSVGETYLQHLAHALGFGWRLVMAGIACIIHALIPALCVRTGSRMISELHDRMVVNRTQAATTDAAHLDFVI